MNKKGKIAGIGLSSVLILALAVPIMLMLLTVQAPVAAAEPNSFDWAVTSQTEWEEATNLEDNVTIKDGTLRLLIDNSNREIIENFENLSDWLPGGDMNWPVDCGLDGTWKTEGTYSCKLLTGSGGGRDADLRNNQKYNFEGEDYLVVDLKLTTEAESQYLTYWIAISTDNSSWTTLWSGGQTGLSDYVIENLTMDISAYQENYYIRFYIKSQYQNGAAMWVDALGFGRYYSNGSWTSVWHDWGREKYHTNLEVTIDNSAGGTVEAKVQVDIDNDDAVDDEMAWTTLNNGSNVVDISGLSKGIQTRVKFRLTAPGSLERTPEVQTLSITAPYPPNAPTSLLCENQTNPTWVTTLTPHFNAIYTDNDSGDNASYAQVQVGTDSDWTSAEMWDSGWVSVTDQSGGKLENNERCADITYAGSALTRGVTYYWRIRFQDNFDENGDWSNNQTFTLAFPSEITEITASSTLLDRRVDQPSSGADNDTRIYIKVQDNWGRDWIESCFIWIRDNTDTVVTGFDNLQLTSYENIDENTKRFFADFDPDNALPDENLGAFDVKAQVVDNDGFENTKDYTSLGYQLFEVNDLTVTLNVEDNTPIHQLATSGTIARVSGTVSADNVVIRDNNEGAVITTFDADNYNKTYGLVSPTRLTHGSQGSLYAWARDDTLDGVSSPVTYEVEGDNVLISKQSILNQPDNSILTVTVTWSSDSASATSGTVYIQDHETFQAAISSGSAQIVLNHPSWFYSGAAIVRLYDNADRPLWSTSAATFETKAITYTSTSFTGNQDNATVRATLNYKDGTIPITARIKMRVNSVVLSQQLPDENGLITWGNVDLPDNTTNIQLVLENCYDARTDYVVNCKDVEDEVAYYENTNVDFVITDNNPTIYYGSGGTFSGCVVSKASYVTLKLVENLRHENGSVVDNATITLTLGENEAWSLSHTPSVITSYSILLYTDNWAIMENRSAGLNVKLQQPSSLSPDNENGTTDSTPTLTWAPVTGADNYTLQYSTLENFATYTENSLTENQFTTPTLAENRYYWRIRANGADLVSSSWATRNFWVDSSAPTLDNFMINNGASSTSSQSVTLTLGASDAISGVYQVRFKEGNENWGAWQSYATSKGHTLRSGDGTKTVHAQVRDRVLNESNILSASIIFSTPAPSAGSTQITTPSPTPPPTPDTDPPMLTLLTSIPSEVDTPSLSVQISVSDASPLGEITATLDGNLKTCSFTNDVITISLDNLTDGSHAVVVRVSDLEGNQAERTISFTVKLPPKPVPIEENVEENIAVPMRRQRVENVPAGQQVCFTFAAEVTSIILVPSENVQEMVLGIVRYEDPPEVSLPPFDNTRKVYCYFEISLDVNGTGNYPATLVNFRLEFGVEKAWMENENITDAKLYRLVNNAWQSLSTRSARDDFEYCFYEAEVQGFSIFSIVGIRAPVTTVPVPISSPVEAGTPLAALLVSLGAIGGGIAGGVLYYMRYYVRRRMPKEFVSRRELKEGPWILELKRSLGVLVEERVRELERRTGRKEEKPVERAEKAFRKKPAKAKPKK